MKRTLIALLAAIGLIAMASAATARADGVDRGRMDITNVVGDLVVIGEGSELVTYVGTIDFGDGDVYKMAFFTSAAGDPPPLDRWTRFEDRWEIYEFNSIEFFDQKGKLKDPFPKGDVVAAADSRSLDEQLDCGRRRIVSIERRDREHLLADHLERLSARCEHNGFRCGLSESADETGDSFGDVFAVVDDDQHGSSAAVLGHAGGQRGCRVRNDAQRICDRVGDCGFASDRRHVGEPRAVGELVRHECRDLESESGLPDASGADERDELRLHEQSGGRADEVVPPDELISRERETGPRFWSGSVRTARRIVREQQRLEVRQVAAEVDPELEPKRFPRPLHSGERPITVSHRVVSTREQQPRPFPSRRLAHPPLQVAHGESGIAASDPAVGEFLRCLTMQLDERDEDGGHLERPVVVSERRCPSSKRVFEDLCCVLRV